MNTSSSVPNPARLARILLKDLQGKFMVFHDCMPLAIGIDKQLVARLPEIDRKVLRIALGIHTNTVRYLKTIEKASARLDLDGNPAGEVTEAQRKHASQILRERFKKIAEQRKAQQEAEEAARQRSEKLKQLAAKFSRHTS
jgi:ProP effector